MKKVYFNPNYNSTYIKNKNKKSIIILTSAICRPNIHNKCFSNKLINIITKCNNNYIIKWIINIDKTTRCIYTQEETKNNFKKLIKNINTEFILPEKPSYFNSCLNLINKALEISKKNDIIFILQDDFILKKELDLDEIIQKYFTNMSYISFVFNKFATFPPSLIGYELLLYYKKAFDKGHNKSRAGMDHITRGYIRNISLKNTPIHSFLVNYDINNLKNLLKKKDTIISKQKINSKDWICTYGSNSFTSNEQRFNSNNKNYLITNTKEINEEIINDINSCSEQKINIISFEEYKIIKKELNTNCFHYIRFLGVHTYMRGRKPNYNNTYFRDIGRKDCPIYKTPKMVDFVESQNNIILTTYYSQLPDPQRNRYNKETFGYIKQFYDSVKKYNINCKIFYDGLSDKYIKKYTTDKIKFIFFDHNDYKTSSGNDTRFLVYLDHLNKFNYDNVIISDINGIELLCNPFISIYNKKKIYTAVSRIKDTNNKTKNMKHYWFKNYVIRVYGKYDRIAPFRFKQVLACGFFCGSYKLIKEVLIKIKNEFDYENINLKTNTNYVVYNYIMYKFFEKIMIKGYSSHNGYEEILEKEKEKDKDCIIKLRTAKVWGKLSWDQ